MSPVPFVFFCFNLYSIRRLDFTILALLLVWPFYFTIVLNIMFIAVVNAWCSNIRLGSDSIFFLCVKENHQNRTLPATTVDECEAFEAEGLTEGALVVFVVVVSVTVVVLCPWTPVGGGGACKVL